MSDDQKTESLSNWRTMRGLHYTELAAKAGISTRTIRRIELAKPTNEITLVKLAAALEIKPEQISEWHKEREREKPLRGFARKTRNGNIEGEREAETGG